MYHAQKNQTFIHNETNSPATTEHRYPALPPAVTLSMDQLPFISGGKVSFRVRMPSATSLGLPGKSSVTLVPWLLSYFSAIHNFDSAKKLASFCEVAPREYQSGTSINGRAAMSKIGSAHLRKSLLLPAMVALKYNPALKGLKERLSEKGKPKMVIIGAAMRKLIHIIYGVLKSDEPFDESKVFNA